ncbi:MAG: DUF421 domain-containing protein [Clostridiales bacterium]|nr:DUF421 domain-containing protein [Clostridiales bacterium]
MLTICIRTLILYVLVVVVMRCMGKRQIGQLQPFEFVVAIMISDLATIPMQNSTESLLKGVLPILTLLSGQLLLSYLSIKSYHARNLICGTPKILIENGKIIENNLINEVYNLSDLLEQLRIKNIPNISDVEFAILETNGELSIIPKSQKRPLTPSDMNIPTEYEGIPFPLVIDGKIIDLNLKKLNLSKEWLDKELKKFKIESYKDAFFVSLESNGNLFFQKKSY